MKRCYIGPTDALYDPYKDHIIAPWCIKEFDSVPIKNFVDTFEKSEILEQHKKCCEYAECFLVDDLKKYDAKLREFYYLFFKPYYYYMTFFVWSRYKLVKKFFATYGSDFEFQEYDYDQKTNGLRELIVKFIGSPSFNGWVIKKVIKIIEPSAAFFHTSVARDIDNGYKDAKENIVRKVKDFIREKINILHQVKGADNFLGISCYVAFLLSYFFKRKTGIKDNNLVCKFQQVFNVNDPKEFSEFKKIFDYVKHTILSNSFDEFFALIGENRIKNIAKLYICPPDPLYQEKERFRIVKSFLEGSKIYFIQHGGVYGTCQNHFRSHHIENDYSGFIMWGAESSKKCSNKKIISLPSPWLCKLENAYQAKCQREIVWVTSVHYVAGDGLEYVSSIDVLKYINKKICLYNALEQKIKERIIYRPVSLGSAFEFKDMCANLFPSEGIKTSISFNAALQQSKIALLDYYGTPFYECISMNIPTILFLGETNPFFTPEAKLLFDKFEKLKVLHTDPLEAAQFLNYIYDDVNVWWYSEDIQALRREFLYNYVGIKNYKIAWLKKIISRTI